MGAVGKEGSPAFLHACNRQGFAKRKCMGAEASAVLNGEGTKTCGPPCTAAKGPCDLPLASQRS